MRDPERIDTIIEMLRSIWHELPDYRFWQVINAAFQYMPENKNNTDPFFWEDDVWADMFRMMRRDLDGKDAVVFPQNGE